MKRSIKSFWATNVDFICVWRLRLDLFRSLMRFSFAANGIFNNNAVVVCVILDLFRALMRFRSLIDVHMCLNLISGENLTQVTWVGDGWCGLVVWCTSRRRSSTMTRPVAWIVVWSWMDGMVAWLVVDGTLTCVWLWGKWGCLCTCSVVSCFRYCHQSHDISHAIAILSR